MDTPTILVIEDDLDDQEIIKMLIQGNQLPRCKIEFCKDGNHALRYLSTSDRKPELIISDVNMPE